MLSPSEINEIKNYFQPKSLSGKHLPNPKEVSDNQEFHLLVDGVYIEHKMFKSKWFRKEINASNQVILVEV